MKESFTEKNKTEPWRFDFIPSSQLKYPHEYWSNRNIINSSESINVLPIIILMAFGVLIYLIASVI